jgi:hypothetical protein
VTGLRSQPFIRAIEELTRRLPAAAEHPGIIDNPYYVPFGSLRDTTYGYRKPKFPSNGPSDTVGRWQSRSPRRPLVQVLNKSPKEFAVEPRTKEALEDFFLVKSAQEHFSGEKPRLLDTALWWFRFTDLDERIGHQPASAISLGSRTRL